MCDEPHGILCYGCEVTMLCHEDPISHCPECNEHFCSDVLCWLSYEGMCAFKLFIELEGVREELVRLDKLKGVLEGKLRLGAVNV